MAKYDIKDDRGYKIGEVREVIDYEKVATNAAIGVGSTVVDLGAAGVAHGARSSFKSLHRQPLLGTGLFLILAYAGFRVGSVPLVAVSLLIAACFAGYSFYRDGSQVEGGRVRRAFTEPFIVVGILALIATRFIPQNFLTPVGTAGLISIGFGLYRLKQVFDLQDIAEFKSTVGKPDTRSSPQLASRMYFTSQASLPTERPRAASPTVSAVPVEPEALSPSPARESSSTIHYCPKCQKGISSEFDFCPHCGHDVSFISQALRT